MSAGISQNCISSYAATEELVKSYPDLVAKFEEELFGFALMLTSDMAYAENVLCESFIKVFEETNAGRIFSEREVKKSLYHTTQKLINAFAPRIVEAKIKQAPLLGIQSLLCNSKKDFVVRAMGELPLRLKIVFSSDQSTQFLFHCGAQGSVVHSFCPGAGDDDNIITTGSKRYRPKGFLQSPPDAVADDGIADLF